VRRRVLPVENYDGQSLFSGMPADVERVFRFFRPKPSPVPLIRVGGVKDGAYLVPDCLRGVVACFSPGVANRKDFEDELLAGHGLRSHMIDFSSEEADFATPLAEGMQTFEKKWLSPDGGPDSITLSDWVESREPQRDLLLQMDIEGAEYENLLSTHLDTVKRFRVMVIEFHRLGKMLCSQDLEKVLLPLVEHLEGTFVSVHAHPNNCDPSRLLFESGVRMPEVLEVTFLRLDQFRGFEASSLIQPRLPHPEDISRNVRGKPYLGLGFGWADTRPSFRQIQRRAVAWIFDFSYRNDLPGRRDSAYLRLPKRVRVLLSQTRKRVRARL